MKIGTKKEMITDWLYSCPDLRDDDNWLVSDVWKHEIGARLYNISGESVLYMIASGKLTSAESITRCRRKIQQENPSLRGQKYKARHKEQIEVKQELKDWNNEKK
tara:strand:+ start:103 stop:417 length:315 start_codon:yes stop_codon:yes gene_type:complete